MALFEMGTLAAYKSGLDEGMRVWRLSSASWMKVAIEIQFERPFETIARAVERGVAFESDRHIGECLSAAVDRGGAPRIIPGEESRSALPLSLIRRLHGGPVRHAHREMNGPQIREAEEPAGFIWV